jgi:hypothetical protein
MIKCLIQSELYEHCRRLATRHNIGRRSFGNGTMEQQMAGMIGESYVRELFGFAWMNDADCNGSDPGYDLKCDMLKIDVKTMVITYTYEPRPEFVNNVMAEQCNTFKPEIYIFCTFNHQTRMLTICGYVTRKQFERRREFFPAGSKRPRTNGTVLTMDRDTYEIKNCRLEKLYSTDQLVAEMEMLNEFFKALQYENE